MSYLDDAIEFERQIKQIERKLFLSALTILKNQEDAKDALQEAIFKAYIHRKKLKDIEKFNAWITKILLNEAYRLYKKRKTHFGTIDIDNCLYLFSEKIQQDDILK